MTFDINTKWENDWKWDQALSKYIYYDLNEFDLDVTKMIQDYHPVLPSMFNTLTTLTFRIGSAIRWPLTSIPNEKMIGNEIKLYLSTFITIWMNLIKMLPRAKTLAQNPSQLDSNSSYIDHRYTMPLSHEWHQVNGLEFSNNSNISWDGPM